MRAGTVALVVWAAFATPMQAQVRNPAARQLSLGLPPSQPIAGGLDIRDFEPLKRLGVFTVVPPELRGEMIRVSVPIGALVTQAAKSVGAANRRRQESAARRQVEADRRWFTAQQAAPAPGPRPR